jgi:hypothetical protein
MILVAPTSKVAPTRARRNPAGMIPAEAATWLTRYLGVDRKQVAAAELPKPSDLYPTAFLVEQEANSALRPHFHIANQFQVVVGGSGKIGHHDVGDGSVHFTGPYTAYGPVAAGPEGVNYLTLRNGFDFGGRLMPDCREEAKAQPGRHHREISNAMTRATATALAALREIAVKSLLGMEADGMAAWHYRLPPRQSVPGPDPRSGGGQFWVVMTGGMAQPGEADLGVHSCVFVSDEEATFTATAGVEGLEVLALQFPKRITADA